MHQRYTTHLIPIVIVTALAIWVVASGSIPGTGINLKLKQGLDLRGGLQVLLEADLPPDKEISDAAMEAAKNIVERRVNLLGVSEPLVQSQGSRRIVVELPDISDPDEALKTIKGTALLEFVYSSTYIEPETKIATDCADPSQVDCGAAAAAAVTATTTLTPTFTPAPTLTPTSEITATATVTATASVNNTTVPPSPTPAAPVYHAVMTGAGLKKVEVNTDATGRPIIAFELNDAAAKIFGDFTAAHVNEFLVIVLDKIVLSSPRIESAIPEGRGIIEGNFTIDSANMLVKQLRSGSLPVPLRVAQSREIGPKLGEDSIRKSLIAGAIAIVVLILFMALYYRLPGMIAALTLLVYGVVTVALFKILGVTLTLPGIAGLILSAGVAVDANVLIFERLKEELRSGKNLRNAVDAGFDRAWPSIRDSNISTLISCLILYWFGDQFGASIVKGFALTLAIGVFVSMFTAILATRTILHTFLDQIDLSKKYFWFGI